MKRAGTIGMLTAIVIFFLGMLIHTQLRSDSSALPTSLFTFAAIAVPGGVLNWWLARGRLRSTDDYRDSTDDYRDRIEQSL
ncbi:hypothetical protein [Streptomyces sp. NPDC007172]|uniref:hypothetical protein n=1 Tax=Streptomyces sp. NPDC007172 TaxID=3364776 RepID=UPI00367C291F